MPKETEDIPLESTKLFLFVGPADSGKSFAATSWGFKSKKYGGNDPRPAYLMESDGRVQALRGRPVQYDDYTNVEGAIGMLDRLKEIRDKCVLHKAAPFHTLIFDSFTGFNEFAIADSLEVTAKKREANKGEGGRVRGDLLMPTMEEYGYEAEAVRQLLWENLLDIKRYADVIVTAHEVEKYKKVKTKPGEPTQTELDGYKILARDKISARLPKQFDEIYHFLPKEVVLSKKTIRRRVVFQDEMARTSYPQLLTTEEFDISDKEFYHFWKEKISA